MDRERVEKPISTDSYGVNPVFITSSKLANAKLFPDVGALFSKERGDLNAQGGGGAWVCG